MPSAAAGLLSGFVRPSKTPVSIPLWDETADQLARLCMRVVAMRKGLLEAEARLTGALTRNSSTSAVVRNAVEDLFKGIAASLKVLQRHPKGD